METNQTLEQAAPKASSQAEPIQQIVTTRVNEDGVEVMVVEPNTRLLTLAEREEFEALSLEVFGASSRWSTLLKRGMLQAVTEEVQEYVPAVMDAEGKEISPEETRQVTVNVKYRSPKRGLTTLNLTQVVRFTPESLKAFMLDRLEQKKAVQALIDKMNAEAKAKKEQEDNIKKVALEAQGSAI